MQNALGTCIGEETIFSQLLVSPLDPERLYIIESCPVLSGHPYNISNEMGNGAYQKVLVSSDAGVSWQSLPVTIGDQELNNISLIVPSPVLTDRIYAYNGPEWVESRDGGVQWIKKDFPVNELVPDGQNSAYLYGWSLVLGPPYYRQGMRSEDSGEEWVAWAQQPCLYAYGNPNLIAHPLQTKVLFLRCEAGLYRSDNGGDAWTKLSSTPGTLLSPDYGVLGRILWAKDDGLWASTDSGASWHSLMPNYELTATSSQEPLYLPSIGAD